MVALISPQHVFAPSPDQSARRARSGARHLRAVPSIGDGRPAEMPFEAPWASLDLGRRVSEVGPTVRSATHRLDAAIDVIRWGGSSTLRFAAVAVVLLVAVVSVRLSQGVPPADATTHLGPGAGEVSELNTMPGDIVLSFSSSG